MKRRNWRRCSRRRDGGEARDRDLGTTSSIFRHCAAGCDTDAGKHCRLVKTAVAELLKNCTAVSAYAVSCSQQPAIALSSPHCHTVFHSHLCLGLRRGVLHLGYPKNKILIAQTFQNGETAKYKQIHLARTQ